MPTSDSSSDSSSQGSIAGISGSLSDISTRAQQSSTQQTSAQQATPDQAATDHSVVVQYSIQPELAHSVCGINDANIKVLDNQLACGFFLRGNAITLTGPASEVARARRILNELQAIARRGHVVSPDTVKHTIALVSREGHRSLKGGLQQDILARRGKVIRAKTPGQQAYVDAIDSHTVVFGIGPAGSGKTYLAMAKAVQALQNKEVSRIILTRPAVEAGEKLGFLPGTLSDKIDPYLRPLYDALRDMVEPDQIPRLIESGIIEVAPLAYMRGRTLNDAFVILDEAQNTTPAQMKMFLTRLGFGTTMVITGDMTQADLPRGQSSGLRTVRSILNSIEGIYWAEMGSEDVVRHHLVGAIVEAYDRRDEQLRALREEKTQHSHGKERGEEDIQR